MFYDEGLVIMLVVFGSAFAIRGYLRRNVKELTHFEFMQEAAKPVKGDMAQHYYE